MLKSVYSLQLNKSAITNCIWNNATDLLELVRELGIHSSSLQGKKELIFIANGLWIFPQPPQVLAGDGVTEIKPLLPPNIVVLIQDCVICLPLMNAHQTIIQTTDVYNPTHEPHPATTVISQRGIHGYAIQETYKGLQRCAASAANRNLPTRIFSAIRWWILYGLMLAILY